MTQHGASVEATLIEQAWSAVASDAAPVEVEHPVVDADDDTLGSHFAVAETATACIAAALMAAAGLQAERGGTSPGVHLDRRHVAAAMRSERHFRSRGPGAGLGFAPLSRFWRARDGWVRTHANYPWHRDALLATLAVDHDDDAAVAAAIAERRAADIEAAVFAAGGVAAAVRSLEQWHRHPHGAAVHREPLISHRAIGDAPPRVRRATELPCEGIRVLDLTRVIAGPVCTRFLGALGAEVLRIDPPRHPDMAPHITADTLLAKRSALLDAGTTTGRATLHGLLDAADVIVCGYRPGALERFGLGEDLLAEEHPGLVIAYLNAWGHTGPWGARRGFDSVVQAPTGIAAAASRDDAGEPGALPCQLLDHGTGYLTCAAVLDSLRRQSRDGGTHVRRLSLARTAAWLTSSRPPRAGTDPAGGGEADVRRWTQHIEHDGESITAVLPPGALGGHILRWPPRLTRYGVDAPRWSPSEIAQ